MAQPSSSAAVPRRRDQQAQDDLLASGIAVQQKQKKKCLGTVDFGTAKSFGLNADGTAIDTPKESAKRQRSAGCFDYADCRGGSDEATQGSDTGESKEDITVEYRCALTNRELCKSATLQFDPSLTCGHFWPHLRKCEVDMSNKCLIVRTQLIDPYMKIFLLASVQHHLKTPPEGVLRIGIVAMPSVQGRNNPTL